MKQSNLVMYYKNKQHNLESLLQERKDDLTI